MKMKYLQTMTSRTGRHMQRYNEGCRQVVGCIPFRFKNLSEPSLIHGNLLEDIEVILISSQKGPHKLMFPKGGWEFDEQLEEAAARETFEEAGILGMIMGDELGVWNFKSNSQGIFHEGRLLPMNVQDVRDAWPEKAVRQRFWVCFCSYEYQCAHSWMKEAIDVFIGRLVSIEMKEKESTCLKEFLLSNDSNGIATIKGEEEVDFCLC
ncbi:phosphatase [Lithospermum erythrorhizon]|uniref:Phosphatase n=1 Tax=Lithospermum erythrorhizon TaxID=34254 RepID=A0AAV3RPS3_LITER